jgi:hypothetical protein
MADEANTTPAGEPVADATTSDSGPVADTDTELSINPQPTLEELTARMQRLEGNLKGKSREAEEERQRRQTLERQLDDYHRQREAPPKPVITEASDEELAEQLNEATINGDRSKTASILKQIHQKAKRESTAEMTQIVQQATTQSQFQQSYQSYLADAGLKPGTALQQRTAQIVQEMQDDIKAYGASSRYYHMGNNLAWMTSVAVERAKGALGAGKVEATETARRQTSQSAGTESGARGNGNPPGKSSTTSSVIYLTEKEKKSARGLYDNLSAAEAERRIWDGLPDHIKESRQQNRRAV